MPSTTEISTTGPTAFGVIAERFRRAGQPEKAVTLCREGLDQFPDHLSARVTLGWSLLDMGEFQEAFDQLKTVNKRAPDNLAAIRGLAELHERGIGLVFESMPDVEPELDPVMPAMAAATAAELPEVSTQEEPLEDLDPIFEPEAPLMVTASENAPPFEIEDVIDEGDQDPMFDLAGLLDTDLEPAPQPAAAFLKPLSSFDREPLALRDSRDDERSAELQEWLSRVRERRFNSVSQLMAG